MTHLVGDTIVRETEVNDGPTLQVCGEALAALAVEGAGHVFALGRLEVALESLALVLVWKSEGSLNFSVAVRSPSPLLTFTRGQVLEGLVRPARDDIAAGPGVAAVALDASLIAEEEVARTTAVTSDVVDDEAVLDLRQLVALYTRAGRWLAGPSSIALAQQDGQAGPLETGQALIANDSAVIEALPGQDQAFGVLHLRQWWTLRG